MTSVKVFDPAMCCSTGVCGPTVDPEFARFAADPDWLAGQGVAVERFNLLHRNIQHYGTVFNTLADVCDVQGEIITEPLDAPGPQGEITDE